MFVCGQPDHWHLDWQQFNPILSPGPVDYHLTEEQNPCADMTGSWETTHGCQLAWFIWLMVDEM